MNITIRRLSDSDSDSDTTLNSVENGRPCIVKFRHREFIFERQIYLSRKKQSSPNSTGSESSLKRICLPPDVNNNLFKSTRHNVRSPLRIRGVVDLTSIFDESLKNVPTNNLINLGYKIDFSCDQKLLDLIEMETRRLLDGEYKKLQIGRVCGSVFKDVCHSYSKHPSKQLMSRIYRNSKSVDPSETWLRKNYLTVRTKYERIMIKKHIHFMYRKCGLVLLSEHPQFCAIPGGMVECQCCGRGTVEFYCPYRMRKEKIYSLPCLDETDDYEYELQKSSELYYKVQLHMFLTETNYCDFVIWTTQDYLDIRIKRDDDFLYLNMNVAKTFFLRKILPNMFVQDLLSC